MPSYTLLEPSISSDLGLQSLTNGVASLVASTSFIYGALIMIIVVAAAFRYGLAGIWRIEASSTKIAKSNEEIKRVTLGLLGVLSLFLLISTLNRDLLTGDVQLNNLGTGSVVATGGIVSGGGGNFGGGGASGNTGGPGSTSSPVVTDGSEQANRDALRSAGITVISTSGQTTPCTAAQLTESRPSCTNLAGLPSSVISMLVELKNTCATSVTVTGGTEPGHKSHGPGKSAVDVDDNNGVLNTCIKKFPPSATLGYCTETFSKFGFIFCNERGTSHWHVFK